MLEISMMCSFKDLSRGKLPRLFDMTVAKRLSKDEGDKDRKEKSVFTRWFIRGRLKCKS